MILKPASAFAEWAKVNAATRIAITVRINLVDFCQNSSLKGGGKQRTEATELAS